VPIEEEGLALVASSFFRSRSSINLRSSSSVFFACLSNAELIARGRWVRPYLGYYLGLVEEDWCGILENSLCHVTSPSRCRRWA
jgi:hypothetical protein